MKFPTSIKKLKNWIPKSLSKPILLPSALTSPFISSHLHSPVITESHISYHYQGVYRSNSSLKSKVNWDSLKDAEVKEELAWDIEHTTTAENDVRADRAPEKPIPELQQETLEHLKKGTGQH